MQCAKYLDGHRDWRQMSLLNTAMAAQKVAEEKDRTQAAIAGTFAAKQYGLKVLDEEINPQRTEFYPLSDCDQSADFLSKCRKGQHLLQR